ncbi:MAG: ABC transporter ATP-binding protein [Candidatus Omnitrophica bacterium]|nr:ABC transporter ATP-binding protein [Candidatus Omnitrophota bacterium]
MVAPEVILKTKGLAKCYVNRFLFSSQKALAVDGLDLDVIRGEIFALLGPNGAGKTTTLNMIVGITEPTAGDIEIFGEPFRSGDIEPLKRIGYVPETTSLPGYFTVYELLDFYAQIFDMPVDIKIQRIRHLLEMVGLSKERHVLLRNLSMGQLRLVDFMQALINDPDLILLDEPTVYLDPVIMERFRAILVHLRQAGKTIIMSSHMLPEIERLCDRLAIIDRGRLLKVGPIFEFVRNSRLEEEFLRIVKEAQK